MDAGCYCVNLTRLMAGEEPVQGKALFRIGSASGVDEAFAGVFEFPSGAIGVVDNTLRSHRVQSYDLRGTAGRIALKKPSLCRSIVARSSSTGGRRASTAASPSRPPIATR